LKPSSMVSATTLLARDPWRTTVAGVRQPGWQDGAGDGTNARVGAGELVGALVAVAAGD